MKVAHNQFFLNERLFLQSTTDIYRTGRSPSVHSFCEETTLIVISRCAEKDTQLLTVLMFSQARPQSPPAGQICYTATVKRF